MLKRSEGYFRGHNDFELFYQSWTQEGATATLVITHGLGEHSECYQNLAGGLTGFPVDLIGWDLRGHGRSEGKRGAVEHFDYFCRDLKKFVEFVKKLHPDRPLFLLGHSMGGQITVRTVMDHGDLGAKAMVLSSPLFRVAVHVPKIKETIGRAVASVVPDLTLYNGVILGHLSRDKEWVQHCERDTLRHDRISTRLFVEMSESLTYTLQNASKLQLPLLVMQAGQDRIVSPDAVVEFFQKAGSADKDMKLYDDFYHEIFNDFGRERVYADLRKWLRDRM